MRGIASGGAYVPVGTVGGRRVAGRDEDGFTIAATALERLEDASEGDRTIGRLLLAGDIPAGAPEDLVRFVGEPVPWERFGAGAAGVQDALRASNGPETGVTPVVIVAVDRALGSSTDATAAVPLPSDAGVAVRIAEGDGADPERWREAIGRDPSSATRSVFSLVQAEIAARRGRWVGDWSFEPGGGIPVDRSPPKEPVLTPHLPVSQGAYVPRPRYLENLPSRWSFAAERCAGCGAVTFPARGRCRGCGARDGLETVRLPRDGGEVIAATVIGPGGQPTEFDEQVESLGPYGVVLVELAPGARATLQVTDATPGQLSVGSRVGTRLRRLYPMEGEWRYGRKAVPLPGRST